VEVVNEILKQDGVEVMADAQAIYGAASDAKKAAKV
jgi:hypothetical protein